MRFTTRPQHTDRSVSRRSDRAAAAAHEAGAMMKTLVNARSNAGAHPVLRPKSGPTDRRHARIDAVIVSRTVIRRENENQVASVLGASPRTRFHYLLCRIAIACN